MPQQREGLSNQGKPCQDINKEKRDHDEVQYRKSPPKSRRIILDCVGKEEVDGGHDEWDNGDNDRGDTP